MLHIDNTNKKKIAINFYMELFDLVQYQKRKNLLLQNNLQKFNTL